MAIFAFLATLLLALLLLLSSPVASKPVAANATAITTALTSLNTTSPLTELKMRPWHWPEIVMCKHSGWGNGRECEYACNKKCKEVSPEQGRDRMLENFKASDIDCRKVHVGADAKPGLICNAEQIGTQCWRFTYKCWRT